MLQHAPIVAAPSLREQVAERMRDAILTGLFPPGTRLIERELCEMWGVSRTSVREALRALEGEGLITSVPNRGPIVSTITLETAEAIYQVRGMLEGLAARLFARRASDAQREAMEHAVAALAVAYAGGSPQTMLAAKEEFYRVLLEGAGNPVASGMLETIHTRVWQLRATTLSSPERAQASIAELHELATALRERDEERAWNASTRHIEHAMHAALATLAEAGGAEPGPAG